MTDQPNSADIHMIQRIIPHRYPFLLVDKVVDIDHGVSATGIKNVTFNEPHFQGHFPGAPWTCPKHERAYSPLRRHRRGRAD